MIVSVDAKKQSQMNWHTACYETRTGAHIMKNVLRPKNGSRNTLIAFMCGFAAVSGADTLVLRSGRSVAGELISVSDGRVEFRTDRGRTERVALEDVERIDFSDRARADRGPARPSGLREREMDVPAFDAWTRTGIELKAGAQVWFETKGRIQWGPGRKDGPDGESGSPRNAGRPMPSRNGAALIGKIGEQGDPFYIGADSGPIQVRSGGILFLGINDDYLQDNSGAFRVTVYY